MFMVTTVKLSKNAKLKLDKLQAEIFLSSSKNLSKQQLLEKIIDLSIESKQKLLASLNSGVKYPLKKKDIKTLLLASKDWGVKTKEEDIDSMLYGV